MACVSFILASRFAQRGGMHDALFGSLEPAQDKEGTMRPENHTEKKRIPMLHDFQVAEEIGTNSPVDAAHENCAKHLQGEGNHDSISRAVARIPHAKQNCQAIAVSDPIGRV
jgi:hypothetical protein